MKQECSKACSFTGDLTEKLLGAEFVDTVFFITFLSCIDGGSGWSTVSRGGTSGLLADWLG